MLDDFDDDGTLERVLDRSQDQYLRPEGFNLTTVPAGSPPVSTLEFQTAYDYDLAGRLDQVAQTGGSPTATFDYGFEPFSFSLIETVTGPHHLVTNEWEGTRNVLDSKTNTDFASTPETHSAYDYTVNDLGQRTAVDASGTAFGTSQRDRTWKYDSFGQLVSEADSNNAGFDRGFAFDDIGNRTASISGDTDPSATGAISYTPDALNQYDTITDPASQVSAPSYDADGNATSLSLRKTGLPAPAGSFEDATLIWDGENRLIEIKAANNTTLAKYQYDSQSRRIRRNESAAHDTAYLYDGWNPIAEYRLSAGTYDLHLTNLWGLDLSGSMQGAGGVGGLLAVNVSGTTYYPTYDGNGNVSEYLEHIIDSDPGTAGNQPLTETAVHFEYDAFGNILDFTETSTDLVDTFSHRFSTKQQDHESGLLYYGYRYFDPVTGRWPSRDPIGERGGTNLYGMVGNDAINTFDILGLSEYFNCRKTGGWRIRKRRYPRAKVLDAVEGEQNIVPFKYECHCRERCCRKRPFSSKVDIEYTWIWQFTERPFYYDSFEEELAIRKNIAAVLGEGGKALAKGLGVNLGPNGFPSKDLLNPSALTLEERQEILDLLKKARDIWNQQRKEFEEGLIKKCRETCARKGYYPLNNIWPSSYKGIFDGEIVEEGRYIGSNVTDGGREILPEDLNPDGSVRGEVISEEYGPR